MSEERYSRESPVSGSAAPGRADDIDIVRKGESSAAPVRTLVPPDATGRGMSGEEARPSAEAAAAAGREAGARVRSHLRAVTRSAPGEDAAHDRVGAVVETVGAAVGWTTGYVKSRRPAEIRADTEKLLVASPALALLAAVGFGYLLGSMIRR